MAVAYIPTTHVAPITATAGSVSIDGLSPGRVFASLSDPLAAATVWLPTGVTSDGFPGAMLPFTTGTGTVT